jgi:hypothetical protein
MTSRKTAKTKTNFGSHGKLVGAGDFDTPKRGRTPRSATRHTGTQANRKPYEQIQRRNAGFAAASG